MVITIKPTTKKTGFTTLLFRVRDGRNAEFYYKTDIETTVEQMKDFDNYGNPIKKFGRFDHDLRDAIEAEMTIVFEACEALKKEKMPLTKDSVAEAANRIKHGDTLDPYKGKLIDAYKYYINERRSGGFISLSTMRHYTTILNSLRRYLTIHGRQDIDMNGFTVKDVVAFHKFVTEEYKYVKKYPHLFLSKDERKPTKIRQQNTVATDFKKFNIFWKDMEIQGYIDRSPISKVGRDTLKTLLREQYDAPVFLHADEFQKVMDTPVPESLQPCKDLFLFHCNLGCRIGDLTGFSRDRICVSSEGIPYYRYIAHKTLKKVREDTETPIMLYSLDIIKKYNFHFPLLNYVSGKSGYNKKIQELLKYCGIDRPCKVYNEETEQNEFKPLYELGCSKLCRKTHEDIMVKVQINMYTTGLHRVGSEAVKAYTQLELKDRFRMMCLAFGQPYYVCDQDLNIIKKEDNSEEPSSQNNGDI